MPAGLYKRTKNIRKKAKVAQINYLKNNPPQHLRVKHSDETKKKISMSHNGKSGWHKGTFHTKESKRKMSLSKTGKPSPMKGKKCAYFEGKKNPNWKGGKRHGGLGYVVIYKPNHPFCNRQKCVYEHRLVMEKHLGRYLRPEEVVHHINRIRNDNRIKNLMLFENSKKHLNHHKTSNIRR